MCGIYGIFNPAARLGPDEKTWALEAQCRLQHRGPDGQQCVELMDGHCLLGHLRLAIIDLAGGAQPICNEDGSVWVVCNGEIYNYVELREKLIARGHQFSCHSDTEVLVHLYEEKGADLLEELEGMYAFAIVDMRKRQLFLARDRFGEKPLYWAPATAGQGIAFASEMKALLPLPGVDRSLDIAGIAQFLALGYIPAPRTHLQGVRKLQAGEAIVFAHDGKIRRIRYWRPEFVPSNGHRPPSKEEAVDEVRRRFRQAVRLRLRSDVPVGAFLSGGIDSTLVASTIRDLLPGASFQTFCASFDDEQLNEAPYARQVAQHLGSEHHEVHFSSAELLEVFYDLIDHYDEPFGDCSMFPTFAVCRAARQHCKVMLSGDGGDECFGGYRNFFNYSRWQTTRHFPGVHWAAGALLANWNHRWKGRGLLTYLTQTDWQLLYPAAERDAVKDLFTPDHQPLAAEGLGELREAALRHRRLKFPLSAMEDMANGYLPEQILVKVDRASMRSALECRTPFLDRDLFAFAAALPVEYHFSAGQGKALLRRCLPDWVPAEIRWRRKQGFTPPLATWLRTSLRAHLERAIEEFPPTLRGVLHPGPAQEFNRRHQAGEDCSTELFRYLVLNRSAAAATACQPLAIAESA
jgi:asparagine synthase (glutamine-hydrolysing)